MDTSSSSRERSAEGSGGNVLLKEKIFRKVQIIYYLCRNGQLEHPHFLEVCHLPNQQLRLKDVMDRLNVLRGKGMPYLFSWSCKRSYKNGYIWNDLMENDVILPVEGSEYVLKGSELVEGCSDRFQLLQLNNKNHTQEPIFLPNRKEITGCKHNPNIQLIQEVKDQKQEEKRTNSSLATHCSRGISTAELEHQITSEIALEDVSPPSSSSALSEKTNTNSNPFEDSETAVEPVPNRASVLLELIVCGSTKFMAKKIPFVSNQCPIDCKSEDRKMSLQKTILCKSAFKTSEEDEICYMSENPRFGNTQSKEKEYFSGSIVESITENRVPSPPSLKKSSSYNEERSYKSRLMAAAEPEAEPEELGKTILKRICIPRKKSSRKCEGK